MSFRLVVPTVILATGIACGAAEGTFEGEPIDCTWFADASNCWATAVTEAAACTDSSSVGQFSADRMQCEYESGAVVQFEEALPEDMSDTEALLSHNWNSEILGSDGATCASLKTSSLGAVDLAVSSGTFSMAVVGLAGVQFTCPDGGKYYMEANIEDLAGSLDALSCLDFPGSKVTQTTEGAISVELNAPAGIEDTEVFTCAPAPNDAEDTGSDGE